MTNKTPEGELSDGQIDELQRARNADYHAGKITDHRSYARTIIAADRELRRGDAESDDLTAAYMCGFSKAESNAHAALAAKNAEIVKLRSERDMWASEHERQIDAKRELAVEIVTLTADRDRWKDICLMYNTKYSETLVELDALRKDAERLKLDRLGKECLRTGQEIQRAASELPGGWTLQIEVEKDAGTVKLLTVDFDEFPFNDHCDGLSFSISHAIDAAIAKEKS